MRKLFLVTVKLPKNPDHDPTKKQTGSCPVSPEKTCTDTTGAHHTVLCYGESEADILRYWSQERHFHVTRIEEG